MTDLAARESRVATGPEAVVFDMDGVLLDSEPFWQEAEVEVFASAGVKLEREDCRRTMGMRVDEVVAFWAERRPWDPARFPPERLVSAILDGVVARVRAGGRPLPGVGESLALVRSRGCRLALASSSPWRVIDAVLQTLALESVFELAYSAEHEPKGKPHPGVYLTTCRRLGVSPGRSVAVEDSLAGLRAARAAGMACVMVPDPSLEGHADLELADARLRSLRELDGALLDSLAAVRRAAEEAG